MKALLTLFIIIILLITGSVYGQLATYTGTGGTSTAVTGYPNETVTILQNTGFGTNTACSSGGLSGKTVATSWTSYNTGGPHYYIQILPNAGYQLDVTGFSAGMRISNTGPAKVRYAYSLDGGVTWVDDGTDHVLSNPGCGSSVASSWSGGTLPTGITSTTNGIIVALFPFAPGGATGTFQTNYINVLGTVTPACTPPVISVAPLAPSFCAGSGGVTLTATGAGTSGTYSWSPASGLSATTGASVVANPSATTVYTVTGYSSATCSSTTTVTAIVNPLPVAAPIAGPTTVCVGSSVTLTDTTTGGVWNIANPSLATITGSGVVTGIASGTDTVTYAVTNSCGTATVSYPITINPLPSGGSIIAADSVCVGATISLSNPTATAGGTWSSSNTSIATTGSAIAGGVAAGNATISYSVTTICGTANALHTLVVKPLPSAAPIIGATSVCIGASVTLTDATTGGVWSIANSALATITGSGVVTGIASGTDTVTYAVTNSCGTATVSYPITINPLPSGGAIIAADSVCVGATISLSNPTATAGGTWSSSNTSIATTGSAVAGGVAAGNATISYSVTTICGTANALHTLTVNPLPYAGVLTGSDSICSGLTTTLTPSVAGGIWSSANIAIASVSASGVVAGIATTLATTNVLYTVATFSCGSATASHTITVRPQPVAGVISGTTTLCQNAITTLSTTIAGGMWSSADASVATISPGGVFTGLSNGNTTISYSVTNSCNTAVATIPVQVNALPSVITGVTTVCAGVSAVLSDSLTGGIWSSSNNSVATIDVSGTVYGITPGTVTITYTNATTGCYITTPFMVNVSVPASLSISASTPLSVCAGTPVTYTAHPVNGGTSPLFVWSINGVILAGSPAYTYTPADGDIVRCWFLSSLGCAVPDTASALITMTVHHIATPALSIHIASGDTVCIGAPTTFIPVPVDGGTAPTYQWYVNLAFAGIGSTHTYTPANGDVVTAIMASNEYCRTADYATATKTVTVSPDVLPAVTTTIDPGLISCNLYPVTYTATSFNGGAAPAYLWSVNGVNTATGPTYTFFPANGDVVKVTLTSSYPCVSTPFATDIVTMTVLPVVQPIGSITAMPGYIINAGAYDTFSVTILSGGGLAPAYQWFKNNVPVYGATNSVYITNDLHTGDSVNCVVTNTDQCSGVSVFNSVKIIVGNNVGVNDVDGAGAITLLPNPNNGTFAIKGNIADADEPLTIQITDIAGRTVYQDIATVNSGEVNKKVITGQLPSGMYLLHLRNSTVNKTMHLIIE